MKKKAVTAKKRETGRTWKGYAVQGHRGSLLTPAFTDMYARGRCEDLLRTKYDDLHRSGRARTVEVRVTAIKRLAAQARVRVEK